MARIAGVELPANKHVPRSLTAILGIGLSRGVRLSEQAGIDPLAKMKDLTESEISRLRELVEEYRVEGELRRQVSGDIRRLIEIGSYRGMRHRRGLPVRGQRTRTNARTRKGRKKTIGRKRGK